MSSAAASLEGGLGYTNVLGESLLRDHRDLVLEIAARHALPGVDPSSLVSAGIEGLIDAASRFDASCGRFVDFAGWWIRRRILQRVARGC